MEDTSMPSADIAVIGGFDCHAETHTAAGLDSLGRLLGTAEFAASRAGYEQARRC
jgi:transposase